MKRKYLLLFFILGYLSINIKAEAQPVAWNSPKAGNPIIPGYFADPTVKKFGDTYYLYATTDGNGGGLGPSQVWVSKDFVNWTIMPMNWPTTYHIWAPDVMKGKDGRFYMYYCEPCKIYCGVSETPRGPWKNYLAADTTVLVKDRFVKNVITLDGQSFVDDDGSTYLYWGTWGIYKDFGCGVGKLTPDLKSFSKAQIIPNTQATDFFEAPFMIKKDGIYYFTYSSGSCHDHTYRVQYATSKTGPMGPFVFANNNPILATNADSTIHGPGHHSIIKEGDKYYIVYHRHNNPQSTRGMHRQIAADQLIFTKDGRIEKVNAGHQGIGYLQPSTNPFPNLAFGKKLKASSSYNDWFKPEYAVDDNNATLWRAKGSRNEWIEIDLGTVQTVQRIWTQFEYATSYYQYIIETSADGKEWNVFADKRNNVLAGSPMTDYGNVKARYVRLTITGNEKNGVLAAIWNIKIFSGSKIDPPQQLVHLSPSSFLQNKGQWENKAGMLGGHFSAKGDVSLVTEDSHTGIKLAPQSELVSDFDMPQGFFSGQPYTLSYSIYGSDEDAMKQIVTWGNNKKAITSPAKNSSDNKAWHVIACISDGKKESVYLDSILIQSNKVGKIQNKDKKLHISVGESGAIISNLNVYNWQQSIQEVMFDANASDIVIPQIAGEEAKEMFIDLNADKYLAGTSLKQIENGNGIKGLFNTQTTPVSVEEKENVRAFRFNGTQEFRSTFPLPDSFFDNPAYSVTAWIFNPELDENECIADITPAYVELDRIAFGWGKEPRNGLICHNGWFEDSGLKEVKADNKWHHVAVTYDGYMEKIYVDGKLLKQKDIMLRLPRSPYITLGRTSDQAWPFNGWLHSLKVYNYTISDKDIENESFLKQK
jgi:beta-xylosidase